MLLQSFDRHQTILHCLNSIDLVAIEPLYFKLKQSRQKSLDTNPSLEAGERMLEITAQTTLSSSTMLTPDPPISSDKSLSFGKLSLIGSTVSW